MIPYPISFVIPLHKYLAVCVYDMGNSLARWKRNTCHASKNTTCSVPCRQDHDPLLSTATPKSSPIPHFSMSLLTSPISPR